MPKDVSLDLPVDLTKLLRAYALPALVKTDLTPEVVVDIFLGRITRWNDARIAEANRDIRIPNLPIGPSYRADASGTTFIFTTYLSRVSEDWRSGPGAGTAVRWPAGNGARGNEGVSNITRNTPGAIGYIENAYAVVNRMTTTQLRNRAGNFVMPTPPAFNETAAAADWNVPNFAADTINLDGANSWPMTAATLVQLGLGPAAAPDRPRISVRPPAPSHASSWRDRMVANSSAKASYPATIRPASVDSLL
jgi:phosphate transport system substrate-binding protein